MNRAPIVVAALAAALASAPAGAQDAPKAEAGRSEPSASKPDRRSNSRCDPAASLRIQVVITRFQGEKKLASLPYTFVVSARPDFNCPQSRVRMRMGIDTPVPVMSVDASDPNKPKSTSVQYKTVGTNIDCSADDLGDGRYKLYLTVENSSALPGTPAGGGDLALTGFPLFRRVEMSLEPILRDGQNAQTVASADPVTGEVVKIDVTLNVVK
jgi:hypothetical protein